ncbi:MAG: DUF4265 domain-containing protein [Acidobacteria bacterium]|nr:DUF4265 domain-containing protein [Acidobacteriota bacterium]
MKDNAQNDSAQRKIRFRLEQDEDGYPPNEWETLWATVVGENAYSIDNIPFFVRDVSYGDVVSASEDGGVLLFDSLLRRSKNSVIRVIAFSESVIPGLRRQLERLGCDTEGSHIPNLISVNVPDRANLETILEFLDNGEKEQLWEYESASFRQ